MQFTQLFNKKEDRAVSPVIGVILMVAITVILAAVIGTFVLGLGDQVQQTSPHAQLSFDFDAGDEDVLTIVHEGGDGIEGGEIALRSSDLQNPGLYSDEAGYDPDEKIRAGDSVQVGDSTEGREYQWADGGDGGTAPNDATVRVVWEDSDGDRSSTLKTWER